MASKAEKDSAISGIAANLGREVAHTRAEISAPEPAGDLFADLDAVADGYAGGSIPAPRRGRGRPPGSPNRSTQDLRRYLAERGYRDPLEMLAAVFSADPRELAAGLAGHRDASRVTADDAGRALEYQIGAAKAALPYLHQQQPKAVTVQHELPRAMMIFAGELAAPAAAGDDAKLVIDQEVEGE